MSPLCKRLNNLSVYLQAALQSRTEEGDDQNGPWLQDGVEALKLAQGLIREWGEWWDLDNPGPDDEGQLLDDLVRRTKEAAGAPEHERARP